MLQTKWLMFTETTAYVPRFRTALRYAQHQCKHKWVCSENAALPCAENQCKHWCADICCVWWLLTETFCSKKSSVDDAICCSTQLISYCFYLMIHIDLLTDVHSICAHSKYSAQICITTMQAYLAARCSWVSCTQPVTAFQDVPLITQCAADPSSPFTAAFDHHYFMIVRIPAHRSLQRCVESWWDGIASVGNGLKRFFDFSKNIGHSIGNSRSHRNHAWPIEIVDFNDRATAQWSSTP